MASAARAQNRHPACHATANPACPLGRTHLKSTPLTRAAHPKSTDAPKTAGNAPSGPILRIKLLQMAIGRPESGGLDRTAHREPI
jgi:hypothetical protein